MLGLATHLPDPAVRLVPVLHRLLDLCLQHRPQRLGNCLAGLGVEIHRVEHGSPDVMLRLVVRAVADADRSCAVVAREVVEFLLLEGAFATDPVHHLQRVVLGIGHAGHVGDEREEVVRLTVETERVETPQRERRVAHPCVAVVPVAFATRDFRERSGGGREQGTGRGVGETLQREAGSDGRPGRSRRTAPVGNGRRCDRGWRRTHSANPAGAHTSTRWTRSGRSGSVSERKA